MAFIYFVSFNFIKALMLSTRLSNKLESAAVYQNTYEFLLINLQMNFPVIFFTLFGGGGVVASTAYSCPRGQGMKKVFLVESLRIETRSRE